MTVFQASLICKSHIPLSRRSLQFTRVNPLSLSSSLPLSKLVLNPHNRLVFCCALSSDLEESQQVNDFLDQLSSGEERDSLKTNAGDSKGRLPVVVFLMGLVAMARAALAKMLLSDWITWLRLWRQEKLLQRLIAEADANPKDDAKQTALLAELNKQNRLHASFLLMKSMLLDQLGSNGKVIQRKHCINYLW